MQETQEMHVPPPGRKDPLQEVMAIHPVFLPEKSLQAWQATVHGVIRVWQDFATEHGEHIWLLQGLWANGNLLRCCWRR